MPHLIVRYNSSGPILEAIVGVSEPRRGALAARGFAVPPPLRLQFILDTGADTTMLDEQHMRTLGIDARGKRDILTATSDEKPTECSTYDVSLRVETLGDAPFIVPALEVIARPLFNHSIDGMIGRDLLNRLKLTIDGPQRSFRLDY